MNYKRLLFVINPNAGMRKKESPLSEIIMTFSDYDYETIVCFTKKQVDSTELVRQHAGEEIDLIVCMGGDGTLNETLAGARSIGWDKPIGYIPAGSTNDFAASLGLPSDPVEAAKRVMEGETRPLDLGEFNGRTFVYTASCGIFTKASYETPQKVKNRLGHLAYILEGMKELTQFRPTYMEIDTGTEVFQDNYILVAICNTFSLGGVMTLDSAAVDLGDGVFELLLIAQPRDIQQLNLIIKSLYEQNYDTSLVKFCKVKKATIVCPDGLDWALDGERGEGWVKNDFVIVPGGVRLIY